MENNKPKIFTLNCDSWAGALTKKSVKVEQPKCSKCNRDIEEEIAYSKIQLEVERYEGQDMIASQGVLLVSPQLCTALLEAGVKGFAPIKIAKIKNKHAEIDMKTIPDFIYLAILPPALKNIPIAYDYTGLCDGCGLYLGKYNREKFKLMSRDTTDDAIHLQVYSDTYEGADIFHFADHGEIGVTQKFLDVVKDFNCPENVIIPAEWI